MAERTLVLVKPDGVSRGLVGEVIRRFEQRGLRLCGLKMVRLTEALADRLYEAHLKKDFYPRLKRFMTSAPVVALVLEGPDAVALVRATMGATSPAKAAPGSIRGDLALITTENVVHGADSPERARFEIDLFFNPEELF